MIIIEQNRTEQTFYLDLYIMYIIFYTIYIQNDNSHVITMITNAVLEITFLSTTKKKKHKEKQQYKRPESENDTNPTSYAFYNTHFNKENVFPDSHVIF